MKTGYEVWTVIPHSGHECPVYWAAELAEARSYAKWVARKHGHHYGVYISGKICDWTLTANGNEAEPFSQERSA